MRHALVLGLSLLAAGCQYRDLPNDAVGTEHDPPPAPPEDQLGKTCQLTGEDTCAEGYHCSAGLLDGELADVCVPNGTPLPLGSTCSLLTWENGRVAGDTCESGTVCAEWGSASRCSKPCFFHSDCAADEYCAATTYSPDTKTDPLTGEWPLAGCAKSDACNPLEGSGCDDGTRCLFTPPDTAGRGTYCSDAPVGRGEQGADCASTSDCAAGYICGGLGFCLQLCYQNVPDGATVSGACQPGYYCLPFYGSTEVYGRCE